MLMRRLLARLETVHFQLFSLTDSNLLEKLTYVDALIALELNYFAIFLMFDDGAVACEFLLECPEKTLLVELFANALEERERDRWKEPLGLTRWPGTWTVVSVFLPLRC